MEFLLPKTIRIENLYVKHMNGIVNYFVLVAQRKYKKIDFQN